MKIMIVGGGGREHALAWRLSRSPSVSALVASPGNPGIAHLAKCFASPAGITGYAELAEKEGVDLTVVGPEAPLVDGIVDLFQTRKLQIVGPTQAAARLEGSKIFAKRFFERAGIPTARSIEVDTVEAGLKALGSFSLPVVIKADGLAAGKGVQIATSQEEAEQAVRRLGPALVIEQFLEGEEVSFIGLSTGSSILPLSASQDHKRVFDGDLGPNTGGMGAYADRRILSDQQTGEVMDRVMLPAIAQMRKEGTPFTGFLYAGLMMTSTGPKLLEFNVRLGDPETQALMVTFEGDLGEYLRGSAQRTATGTSVCVVLAAAGYPAAPRLNAVISGIEDAEASGAMVFHAGTALKGLETIVAGGRVLGVTAGAGTLPEAIKAAYSAVKNVNFDGMHYRTDIGSKGLRRW